MYLLPKVVHGIERQAALIKKVELNYQFKTITGIYLIVFAYILTRNTNKNKIDR